MVLHEEDERKRLKEEEQKQLVHVYRNNTMSYSISMIVCYRELDKSLGGVVSHLDPRLNQVCIKNLKTELVLVVCPYKCFSRPLHSNTAIPCDHSCTTV